MTGVESAGEPLKDKVFLLTGASRGIGAATAIELAKRGATVIGPHRDPGKDSRAAQVVRQVEELGGRMLAPVCDVTQFEHRTNLLQQIKQDFGKIDGIIFNHAGGLEKDLMEADPDYHLKVNGYSKYDLFLEARAVGVLADSTVVIDVPSLWSKFQHTDIQQLPAYDPVAEGKKLGEQLLREATRAYNSRYGLDGKEVKFGSVCGHAIGDTTTVRLLARMDKEAMAEVEQTAQGGKLPTIADMAQAITAMAEGKFEDEEIVYVGPPQIRKDEIAQALPMYSTSTRYVDSLVRFDDSRSFGFYRVREKDTQTHFSLEDGTLKFDRTGKGAILDVTNNHTIGHFTADFGGSVFPGIKTVAASTEVALHHLINEAPYMIDPRLTGIEGPIEFKVPVLPGDRLSIRVTNPDESAELIEQGTDVSVKISKTEVASVPGLKFEPRDLDGPDGMTLDRLIEAGAQTLGLAYLHGRDPREVLPLFGGVRGPVEYIRNAQPGELLEMEAVLAPAEGTKQFSGDVTFRVDDEVIAKVPGYNCRLFPAKSLSRVIRMLRMKL